MRHPPPCSCPPKPPAYEGVLLPKILASEHCSLPRLSTELCLSGLPDCLRDPLRISCVQASGALPSWTQLPDSCGRTRLRVSIPVVVQVCDACGASYPATAVVEAETCLPPGFGRHGFLFIVPSVQLLCAENAQPCRRFPVQLCVTLDLYLLRFEPSLLRPQKPACPPLPLYPPPIDPHRRPQCQPGCQAW